MWEKGNLEPQLPSVIEQIQQEVICRPAMIHDGQQVICQRCNTVLVEREVHLTAEIVYCPACIEFGRVTSQHQLVSYVLPQGEKTAVSCAWSGKLTKLQAALAQKLVTAFHHHKSALVWAVTGAGKTEMLFPVIQAALAAGKHVAVTSPRIDVCRELVPRLQAAFPTEDVLLRFGGAEENYRDTPFLVATTHQLLYFYQAFDLLVVDEIDAFPYEGDARLHYAVQQAVKKDGSLIYLSATPTKELRRELTDEFTILQLPVRYHRRPLIQPTLCWFGGWAKTVRSSRRLRKLRQLVSKLLRDNRVLLFCPTVSLVEQIAIKLSIYLPEKIILGVHGQDHERAGKITALRENKADIVITSTILERGVTFENVSVVVLGADHPVFSKSALVQIAGRVDRKGAFNHGRVIFLLEEQTLAIREACQEIKQLNRAAAEVKQNEM